MNGENNESKAKDIQVHIGGLTGEDLELLEKYYAAKYGRAVSDDAIISIAITELLTRLRIENEIKG